MAADTALDRIERILQILPLAARDGGIGYDELAERLGTNRRALERDITDVTEREFYHSAGSGADIQVGLDSDRVRAWTTGALRRPARLTPGETAALDLGLRLLAAEREEPGLPQELSTLRDALSRAPNDDGLLEHIVADGDPDAGDAIRALLIDAARRRRRCSIRYLKPDADAPEDRQVEPYAVVYAEGRWYVLGRSPERDAVRAFRIDRILEASVGTEAFEMPADFEPGDHLDSGRVYSAAEDAEVAVRFSSRVAPWAAEQGDAEPQADGSVLVRYRVADPGWLLQRVLQFGDDAEVIGPAEMRKGVVQALRFVGSGAGSTRADPSGPLSTAARYGGKGRIEEARSSKLSPP